MTNRLWKNIYPSASRIDDGEVERGALHFSQTNKSMGALNFSQTNKSMGALHFSQTNKFMGALHFSQTNKSMGWHISLCVAEMCVDEM